MLYYVMNNLVDCPNCLEINGSHEQHCRGCGQDLKATENDARIECRSCAEKILKNAIKCRFCGDFVRGIDRRAQRNPPSPSGQQKGGQEKTTKASKRGCLIFAAIATIGAGVTAEVSEDLGVLVCTVALLGLLVNRILSWWHHS